MKKVLITGAAGFVPSHVVDAFLAKGYQVVGVDNFVTGSEENISHLEGNEHFTLITADVSGAVEYIPDGFVPEYVLHMASPASPPRYQEIPVETYSVNAFGAHYLLEWIRNNAPKARFLFASTSEVYGNPLVHPQTEDYWGNVNPNGARSCYDESKRLGETVCGVFNRQFGIDTRIIRIFNTYGPRMDMQDGRVIPNFLSQAMNEEPFTIYGDGAQTRSYCFVSDLVAGIVAFIENDKLAGETINLGNPGEFTVKQTAEVIHALVHPDQMIEFQYRPIPSDDPVKRKPNIEKAQRLLGWKPKVTFEDGMKKMIEWHRATQ